MREDATTRPFAECAKMLAACVTGRGNFLLNAGPTPTGALRPEEQGILDAFGPWMETYGESIHGTRGGPYVNGEWGGAVMRGDDLYLHVFEWKDGALKLPALPREVLDCRELGGEGVTFRQDEKGLVLTLAGGKTRDTHSVVKLALAKGDEMPLIPVGATVEEAIGRTQVAALEDPMGGKAGVRLQRPGSAGPT
ncbi:MAG: alpha-L-fucosidase [Planctomycetota bacterium]